MHSFVGLGVLTCTNLPKTERRADSHPSHGDGNSIVNIGPARLLGKLDGVTLHGSTNSVGSRLHQFPVPLSCERQQWANLSSVWTSSKERTNRPDLDLGTSSSDGGRRRNLERADRCAGKAAGPPLEILRPGARRPQGGPHSTCAARLSAAARPSSTRSLTSFSRITDNGYELSTLGHSQVI